MPAPPPPPGEVLNCNDHSAIIVLYSIKRTAELSIADSLSVQVSSCSPPVHLSYGCCIAEKNVTTYHRHVFAAPSDQRSLSMAANCK